MANCQCVRNTNTTPTLMLRQRNATRTQSHRGGKRNARRNVDVMKKHDAEMQRVADAKAGGSGRWHAFQVLLFN